ncbi:MAG: FitA-like ribbon-helix-helix domain-containing protein [Thermoanaerobaculia bacterium]
MKAVQIRHVPEPIHRRLKAQAAASGQSLSDYLLAELRRLAERPTREEMLSRLKSRPPVTLRPSAAELIAEDRLER